MLSTRDGHRRCLPATRQGAGGSWVGAASNRRRPAVSDQVPAPGLASAGLQVHDRAAKKGEARMRFGFLLPVVLGTVLALPALAQSASYTWTGYGRSGGVGGSGNCSSYKMKVDVTVNGTDVKGLFQQEGRPQRNFQATADASGNFRTKAQVQGGTMDVRGTINASTATVLLDGYCKFEAKLKKV
jgi:hypothetical protein